MFAMSIQEQKTDGSISIIIGIAFHMDNLFSTESSTTPKQKEKTL